MSADGLRLVGGGAVTAVGLDLPQTCAGIRARMARFELVPRSAPFGTSQAVARVPAHWRLRRTPSDWLAQLAARAVREVLARHAPDPRRCALVLLPPEPFRHAAFDEPGAPPGAAALGSLAARVASASAPFGRVLQTTEGGAAALAAGLSLAHQVLRDEREAGGTPRFDHVLLAAADSYVLEPEFDRLDRAGRLRNARSAQGLTPGEGAACLLLGAPPSRAASPAHAVPDAPLSLRAWAEAHEPRSALSDDHSQGRALVDALRQAASRAGDAEPSFGWTVSNHNGERYAAWEAAIADARWFRTRRARLDTLMPAMSVGETGAASGPLAVLAAAHRFRHAGRGTRRAMVMLASEAGGRAACVVAPPEGAPA